MSSKSKENVAAAAAANKVLAEMFGKWVFCRECERRFVSHKRNENECEDCR